MATQAHDIHEKADALEHQKMTEMNKTIYTKSALFNMADGKIGIDFGGGGKVHSGEDPRLPKMPAKPTLQDFFRLRFNTSSNHLMQSAKLAMKTGAWPAVLRVRRAEED